jgi:hypothetical protein
VCGCDRRVHRNDCAAAAAGVDLSLRAGCGEPLPGWIACGPRFCETRTSYCQIVLSDVAELPSEFECKPLPASCSAANDIATSLDCSCFPQGTRCTSFCSVLDTATTFGFRLTCVGGG